MPKSTKRKRGVRIFSGSILARDCVAAMRELKPGCVDLVFADPPFNIGFQYDSYDDRRSDDDYFEWSYLWIEQVARILKPGGAFWLAIGDEYAAELKVCTRELFELRSWVIWYYTFGVHCERKFGRSHTHLLHFVKPGAPFTFNADAVRVPSARQLVYNDKRANGKGRVPDDTWIVRSGEPRFDHDGYVLRPQDLPDGFPDSGDTWHVPRVAGTFKERQRWHGCQMPEEILARIIRVSSNEREVVLDPFVGSGTTLAVAKKLNRRWCGYDISEDYVERALERVNGVNAGDAIGGTS